MLDQQVRNVTDALRHVGMWDDTLLIFMSDNGGPCGAKRYCPELPQSTCAGCNLPLRGYKHTLYEGGIRTPAFIHGPGVPQGRVVQDSGSFIHVTDWFPTILSAISASASKVAAVSPAIAGQTMHRNKVQLPLDGISAWNAIAAAGRTNPPGKTSAGASAGTSLPRTEAVFQYDAVLPPVPPSGPTVDTTPACHMTAACRQGDVKLILWDNGTAVMYNVFTDPTEQHPITNDHRLEQTLRKMLRDYALGSVPAYLPPSDAASAGGAYNISACGPEGKAWPFSSGVWVPWRPARAPESLSAGSKALKNGKSS